ncbi:DEAD/DEAH box helicase [Pseudoalteromonas sp. YIC-656]|uniref:DEAD/DEAH box helicase n=1 Tax=Pseudoalteromonas pernae TaxID=3118054 RepID=UPI003242F06B
MSSSFTKEDLLAVFAEINSQGADFPFSEQMLKNMFTKGVYSRAQQMLRDEQILWVKSNDDYTQVDAQVMDDDGTTFDQQITINCAKTPPEIEAHCSCSAKIRCKHVASALLQLKLQSQGEFAHQYQIEDWFGELGEAIAAPPASEFVLLFELQHHNGALQLIPKMTPNSPEGLVSQGRFLTEQQAHAQVTPKGLDEDDFRLFSWVKSQNMPGQTSLSGLWGSRALHQLLSRGRLFAGKNREPLLAGKPLRLEYSWCYENDKASIVTNIPDFDFGCVLNTSPPHYLDVHNNEVIALETHLDAKQIKQLGKFPEVLIDDVKDLTKRINKKLGPVLSLGQKKKPKSQFTVRFITKHAPFFVELEGQLPTESTLSNLGFESCKGALRSLYLLTCSEQMELSRQLFEIANRLSALGGRLLNVPRTGLKKVQHCKAKLTLKGLKGHRLTGYFQLSLDEQTVLLTQQMLEDVGAYSSEHFYVASEHAIFACNADAATQMLEYLKRYGDAPNRSFCSIPRSLFEDISQCEFWQTEIEGGIEVLLKKPTLASLRPVNLNENVTLREYQQAGVNWLQLLSFQGLGAVLADDMGLGKTLQVIAYLSSLEESISQPHLIICPTSLVGNWLNEFSRFAPQIPVQVVGGTNRVATLSNLHKCKVIITTYTLFKRDFAFYHGVDFHTIVLDEAQAIKNAQAQLSQKVKQLKARFRLALSGTPFENNLLELKSVFDFAMPSLLGSDSAFRSHFVEQDLFGRNALSQVIRPYLLRRAKADVLSELPSKTELVKQLEMLPEQAKIYQSYHRALHNKLSHLVSTQGMGKSKLQFLDALLKLRQICCHPHLVDEQYEQSSAKLVWLKEHLPLMLVQNHHVIIFSQFTSMLRLIARQLEEIGIDYALLTGQTRNRQQQVDDFQEGRKSVFLISLKAGGSGLNLTKADTVIHFDPWWNPAVEHQATDRAYRMGQDRSVFVYKLIMANSVEEQVMALADKKRNLVDEFLNGTLLSDKKIDDNQLLEMLNLENTEKP